MKKAAGTRYAVLVNPHMRICAMLGFTSGMPLWVLFVLVPAWLRSAQVDLDGICGCIDDAKIRTLPPTKAIELGSVPATNRHVAEVDWSGDLDAVNERSISILLAPEFKPSTGSAEDIAYQRNIVLYLWQRHLGHAVTPKSDLRIFVAHLGRIVSEDQELVVDVSKKRLIGEQRLDGGPSMDHVESKMSY